MTKKAPRWVIAALVLPALCLPSSCANRTPAPPSQPEAAHTRSAREENMPLFIFIYRPGPVWKPGRPMREQGLMPHGAYIKDLLDRGILFAAGPLPDVDGGLAIVRAASLDEAKGLLASDPAVTSGIFSAEVQSWMPKFTAAEPLSPSP